MNLTEAFRTLDHSALDAIYYNLPFLQTLSQTTNNNHSQLTDLRDRQTALAEALLLARDVFSLKNGTNHASDGSALGELGELGGNRNKITEDQTALLPPLKSVHTPTRGTPQHQNQAQLPLLPCLSINENGNGSDCLTVDSSKPSSRTGGTNHQTIIGLPQLQPAGQFASVDNNIPAAVNIPFSVPPTVNPYDPVKDYLPTWLKRTYMYWRWTLKLPAHDIPQRYAVWIALHLNHPSIKYHLQSLVVLATSSPPSPLSSSAKFKTSVDVNEYILKHAAGHIRVQEELAREEFRALRQPETMSIIAFNAHFLRVFSKIRHFYHQERLAIQYYDRIVPRVRKRLNVNFYERYTTKTSSGLYLEVPSQSNVLSAAATAGENTTILDPNCQKRLSSPLELSFSAASAPRKRVSKHPTGSCGGDRERRYHNYPTLEALMLEAEQVDDFHRPLPPVPQPKKQGFLGTLLMTSSQKHAASNARQKQQQSLAVVDIYGGAADDSKTAAVIGYTATTYYDPAPGAANFKSKGEGKNTSSSSIGSRHDQGDHDRKPRHRHHASKHSQDLLSIGIKRGKKNKIN